MWEAIEKKLTNHTRNSAEPGEVLTLVRYVPQYIILFAPEIIILTVRRLLV